MGRISSGSSRRPEEKESAAASVLSPGKLTGARADTGTESVAGAEGRNRGRSRTSGADAGAGAGIGAGAGTESVAGAESRNRGRSGTSEADAGAGRIAVFQAEYAGRVEPWYPEPEQGRRWPKPMRSRDISATSSGILPNQPRLSGIRPGSGIGSGWRLLLRTRGLPDKVDRPRARYFLPDRVPGKFEALKTMTWGPHPPENPVLYSLLPPPNSVLRSFRGRSLVHACRYFESLNARLAP